MATTKLSQLGGIVCVDGRDDELIMSAMGDGASYPGMGIVVIATDGITFGDIIPHDVGASDDRFSGILLPKYDVDCDAVAADGKICEYVIPKSGHRYNIKVYDMGAAEGMIGTPVRFDATHDGLWLVGTTALEVKNYCALVSKVTVDNDEFVEVIWRA